MSVVGLLGQQTGAGYLDALVLMGVGMGVVFLALLLLLAAIMVLSRLGGVDQAEQPTKSRAAASTGTTAAEGVDDPRLIAVLAAAATACLQRQVRVTGVRRADDQ